MCSRIFCHKDFTFVSFRISSLGPLSLTFIFTLHKRFGKRVREIDTDRTSVDEIEQQKPIFCDVVVATTSSVSPQYLSIVVGDALGD